MRPFLLIPTPGDGARATGRDLSRHARSGGAMSPARLFNDHRFIRPRHVGRIDHNAPLIVSRGATATDPGSLQVCANLLIPC